MTEFNFESKALTASDARALGSSNSLLQGGRYLGADGGEPVDFPGPLPGNSVFDYEPMRDRIERGEKTSLMARQSSGSLGGPKLRATGWAEWDHLVIAFDRDQSRELAESGLTAQEEVRDILTQTMNEGLQNADQKRQVIGFDLHTDKPEFHFHGLIHRFGIYDNECSKSIDQTRSSESNTLKENINSALHLAGYTYLTTTEFREKLDGYEFQEDIRIDEPDPGRSIAGNARTLEPNEQKISSAISKSDKRIAELQRLLNEEEQAKEDLQHGLAGLVQIREANLAAEAAEAAQLVAEADRDAALEQVIAIQVEATQNIEAAENRTAEAVSISEQKAAEAAEAEARAAAMADDLEAANMREAELTEQSISLSEQLEIANSEINTITGNLKTTETERDSLRNDVQSMSDELKASRKSAYEMNAENVSIRAQMEAEQEAFKTAIAEMGQLRAENTSLVQQLADLKDSMTKQIREMKEILTGSLRNLLKWRRSESDELGASDRSDLAKLTNSQKNDDNGPRQG